MHQCISADSDVTMCVDGSTIAASHLLKYVKIESDLFNNNGLKECDVPRLSFCS